MPSKKEQLKIRLEDWEDDLRADLRPYRDNNQLSAIVRLSMYVLWNRPIPPDLEDLARQLGRPATDINEDVIDELLANQQAMWDEQQALRADMSELRDLISAGEGSAETHKLLAKLARRMDDLEHRLDTMQVIGAVEVDTPPPTTREERMSGKLKSISFGALH